MKKLTSKIVGYKVVPTKPSETIMSQPVPVAEASPLPPTPLRPFSLPAAIYHIPKKPDAHTAFYVSISNTTTTPTHPYEVFINTSHNPHYQWVTALSRVLSALFRTNSNEVPLILNELSQIHDPAGGRFVHKKYQPSTVAEIASIIKLHIESLNVAKETVDTLQTPMLLCPNCNTHSMVLMDNCPTCTSCAYSKCG